MATDASYRLLTSLDTVSIIPPILPLILKTTEQEPCKIYNHVFILQMKGLNLRYINPHGRGPTGARW